MDVDGHEWGRHKGEGRCGPGGNILSDTMFVNLSNHPVESWGERQRSAAEAIGGEVVDFPFPEVSPEWGVEEVEREVERVAAAAARTNGSLRPARNS